jgi:hypothetical protein
MTKTSGPSVVPLSDVALGTISGTHRLITTPHVFKHDDGQRYSTFANIFAVIARRAGSLSSGGHTVPQPPVRDDAQRSNFLIARWPIAMAYGTADQCCCV